MMRPDRPTDAPFQLDMFEKIGRALDVTELWAWGSRSRGCYVAESDWDVLVTQTPDRMPPWAQSEADRVSAALGIKLDLHSVPNPSLFVGAIRIELEGALV